MTITKPNLSTELTVLIADRKKWEALQVVSNKQLYEVLTGCVRLTELFTRDELVAEVKGFKVRSDTSIFLIAVKLVLGRDNDKQSSAYAKAIENGVGKGKTSKDIADWLLEKGIERARLRDDDSNAPKAETAAEKAAKELRASLERADTFISEIVSGIDLPEAAFVGLPVGTEYAFFATTSASGEIRFTFATTHAPTLNALKAALGNELAIDEKNSHSVIFSQEVDDQNAELEDKLAAAKQ